MAHGYVEADPADVEQMLGTMNPHFIYCRDFGHDWQRVDAQWISKSSDVYLSYQACSGCKSRRERLMQSGYVIGGSGIDYSEGYLAPPSIGRIAGAGKAVIRRAGDAGFLDSRGSQYAPDDEVTKQTARAAHYGVEV